MVANTTAIGSSILLAFLEVLTKQNDFAQRLIQLTNAVKVEYNINTVLLISHDNMIMEKDKGDLYNTHQILKTLMQSPIMNATPVITFKGNSSYFLWSNFNRRFLAIADLKGNLTEDQQLLTTLWRSLKRNLLTKLILLAREDVNDVYIRSILNYCHTNKALNAVFIKQSLKSGLVMYSFQAFPKFEMTSKELEESQTICLFKNKVKNMQGHPLNFVMKKFTNKILFLKENNKTSVYGGYVGHFFMEFARKYNATLKFPNYDEIDDIDTSIMEALVENGTYDVSGELFNFSTQYELVYSLSYHYLDWCLMVPVEQPIPAYKYYFLIFDVVTLIMIFLAFVLFSLVLAATYIIHHERIAYKDLFFNIYVLNGLLGQPFKAETSFTGIRSFICMLICLLGLVFNTSYVSNLHTMMTTLPTEHPIRSMEDIRHSGFKIALHLSEYEMLKVHYPKDEFKCCVKILDSYAEFHNLRNRFDSRYVYPVSAAQWAIFDNQQKLLSTLQFRLTNICFLKMFGMQFPLQSNSPYEDAFNFLIGQVHQYGLYSHWKSLAFSEFKQVNKEIFQNKTTLPLFEPMKLEDMKLLIFLFGFLMVLICICFAGELYWANRVKLVKKMVYAIKCLKQYFYK